MRDPPATVQAYIFQPGMCLFQHASQKTALIPSHGLDIERHMGRQ